MKILSLLVAALVVASTAGDATPKKESWNADILSGRRSLQNLPPFQDPSLRIHLASIFSQLPVLSQFETPIAIRWTSLIDAVFWNCVATYSDAYKDALTRQRPLVSGVPKAMYNDNNKLMCGLNAFAVFLTMALPPGVPLFQGAATQLGITVEFNKLPAVQSCTDGPSGDLASCLNSVAQGNEHSSAVVGNIVGVLAAEHAFADGWNQLGTEKCTANCRAYADTTNYRPFKLPLSGYGRSFLRLPRIPWQPLVEDNGKGFFYRQEHVTPHIGKKGVSRFLSSEDRFKRKLPYHSYDYRKEIPKVLRRMRALDDKRKLEIEFHDNKLEIAANAYIGFVLAYNPSYDEAMRFIASYTAGEYDATMVVWGEKIRQSLVRPTTLIKWRGGRVNTWAGPGQGVKRIDAKDFEAYIRVMPHAEFPSGSSCLCQVVEEFVSNFLTEKTGQMENPLPFQIPRAKGSSIVEPGVVPAEDMVITYSNISEVAKNCAYTRLDGGMHFTASVPKGQELCKGIGDQGYKYSRLLAGL